MQLSELAHTRPSLPGLPCTSPSSPPTHRLGQKQAACSAA